MTDRRVFVTGAGGFIGGRIVEVLDATDGFQPVAGLRTWANGARIGRLSVAMRRCDVLEPDQIVAALEGVDCVVHCARGTREVTVRGTRNVLEAALRRGTERVVHLSTCDVYGDVQGRVSETKGLEKTGAEYGDSKIEAEEVCREFRDHGLSVTVLRPTLVYGPFSESWTIEFAERIVGTGWMIPERFGTGTCNLLYVDDLVAAVLAALSSEAGADEDFNVNGSAGVTWNRYLRSLASALGMEEVEPDGEIQARLSSALMMPVRKTAKELLKRFEGPIMSVYQRSSVAQSLMKALEHRVRMVPTTDEYRMYRREVRYSTEKIEELLKWTPSVDVDEGVALSARWLRHHGVGAEPGVPVK